MITAEVISRRQVRKLRASFHAAAAEIVDSLLDLRTFDARNEFAGNPVLLLNNTLRGWSSLALTITPV